MARYPTPDEERRGAGCALAFLGVTFYASFALMAIAMSGGEATTTALFIAPIVILAVTYFLRRRTRQ